MAFTQTKVGTTALPAVEPERIIDTSNIPLTSTKDIEEGIKNQSANIPVRESMDEGVGALISSETSAIDSAEQQARIDEINKFADIFGEDFNDDFDQGEGVTPFRPVRLPSEMSSGIDVLNQEQAANLERGYVDETNQRSQEAKGGINFFNNEGNFDSTVTKQSLTNIAGEVGNTVNKIAQIYDDGDAAVITNFTQSQTERSAIADSAWSKWNGGPRLLNLNDQSDRALGSGLAVVGSSWFDDIVTKRYINQALNDANFKEDTKGLTPYQIKKYNQEREIDKPLSKEEVVKAFEEGEPILNAMIASGASNFLKVNPTDLQPFEVKRNQNYQAARRAGVDPQEAEAQVNETYNQEVDRQKAEDLRVAKEMSIVYLKDLTDQGYIAWARNKRGKVIPVETPTLMSSNILSPASKINILYNIEARDSQSSGIMASPSPNIIKSKLSKNSKQLFLTKTGKVVPSDGAKVAMDLQGSVGIGVNPISLAAMMQIYNSTDPFFSNTLSELGPSAFQKYLDKHDNAIAQKIIEDKRKLLNKEVADIKDRANKGLTLYAKFKQSLSTLRFFPITNNLNLTGQKGTTRPTMSFKGITPVQVSKEIFSDGEAVLNRVKEIYASNNKFETLYRGQSINDQLHELKKNENSLFQAMNFYYNLGFQYMKHLEKNSADTTDFHNKESYTWSTPEIIEYGIAKQNEAAILGKQYIESIKNNTLLDFAKENKWMTEKGEWQYPSTVITDAYQIQQALEKGGNPYIRLENLMEQDARQSNAGIISLLVGDDTTAGLLGMVNGQVAADFSGLREKIFDGYKTDIEFTFGEGESKLSNQWVKVFRALEGGDKADRKSFAAKIYSRGLVVAGLYGKTTQKMYSEASDMLSKINAVSLDDPKVLKAFTELTEMYNEGVSGMEILDDITDILTTASQKHMSKLNGYQSAIKSLGGAMAAINAPTSITNMMGGIQEISGNNLSPVLHDNVKMQVFGDNVSRKNIAGMDIIQYQNIQDRAVAAKTRIDDRGVVTEQRAGTMQRNAWPVDIIQGGDSTIMTLALLAMNSPTAGFSGTPVQVQVIHDAVMSGPEAHLIATNAYNNIAIPVYAKNVQPLMSNVVKTYKEHLKYVKEKYGKEGANIGTQFIGGEDSVNKSFHGLTGYFDRLYDIAYRGAEDTINFPDMSIKGNLRTKYITSRQYDRAPEKEQKQAKTNLRYKAVLEIARDNGYIPPTEGNDEARKVNRISGKEFINLIDIMRANSGLLGTKELPIETLSDAWDKLPDGFKVSLAATRYYMVPYTEDVDKTNGGGSSGVISKITGNNLQYVNNVLNKLKDSKGFITHLR